MIRFTPLARVVTLTLAMAASTVSASAQPLQPFRMTFGAFRSAQSTEWQATPGGDVYDAGFGVFAAFGSGARNVLGTWGVADSDPTLLANVPRNLGATSAAMFGTAFNEQINMFREDEYLFNLTSIDLGHMYSRSYTPFNSLSAFSLTFTGFLFGGGSITQTFNVPVPSEVGGDIFPELTTFVFDSRWRNLVEVAWLQGNGSTVVHQFSNITGAIVTPEPSTYILMATGLVVLWVSRRRRLV